MPLLLGHRPDQVIRQHHPGQPERRAEGLGGGADVRDAPGGHALQRAHRLPVVAELPVVVVLDDQAARRPRPLGQRVPAGRVQGRPGRVLVGGSHHDRTRCPPGDPGQGLGAGAAVVDRQRQHGQAGPADDLTVEFQARILHRDRGRPRGAKHPRKQRQGLDIPRGDHDLVGRREHAAGPAEVFGQRGAQLDPATRVAVAVDLRPGAAQRAPGRPQPGRDGEQRHVGPAGAQIVPRDAIRPARPSLAGRRGTLRQVAHDRARSLPHGQEPLGHQLIEGRAHGAAGQAQVGGERPGRGQPGVRSEPAGADRVPQRALEPGPPAGPGVGLQVQVDAESGPIFWHETGSYPRSTCSVGSQP